MTARKDGRYFKTMAKQTRIPITITEEQLVILKKLMKQENRSRAHIATMVFQDGLKLVENGQNTVQK